MKALSQYETDLKGFKNERCSFTARLLFQQKPFSCFDLCFQNSLRAEFAEIFLSTQIEFVPEAQLEQFRLKTVFKIILMS